MSAPDVSVVQIQGCYEDDEGQVLWASPSQAEFFGVYMGRPGAFVWQGDFSTHEGAHEFAYALALINGLEVEDSDA